jgi:putative ABC transport system permease protein
MDFRYSLRAIARRPAFAALVVATMAVGIGANTAMFGIIRAVFLRPLPLPDEERLVTLWEADPERGIAERRLAPASFVDWRDGNGVAEAMGTLPNWTGESWPFNVVTADGTERVRGIYASSGFFRVVGVPPLLGRTFADEDDRQQGRRNVVLSHAYWQQRFASDPGVLGRKLEVDTFRGGAFTVVGVMPEGFELPRGARFWLSLGDWGGGPMPPPDTTSGRCCAWYTTFAKLKPGVTPEQAARELTVIARRVSARHPEGARVSEVKVVPLRRTLIGTEGLTLLALFGAVGCVLAIGCANVANLLLSRGITRRAEIRTRMALGATRSRIARQLVVESLVLCGAGAVAGGAAAFAAQRPLARMLSERVPLAAAAHTDWTVLLFAAALTIGSALACGLAPLVEWSAADWAGRARTEGTASRRLRSALVIGEVALAVTLVATASLLVRTLAKLDGVEAGFSRDRTLVVSLDTTTGPLRGRGNSARFLEDLLPRIAALPGVRAAGATTGVPLESGAAEQPITREGHPLLPAADSPRVLQTAVTPGYFAAMGVPLRRGRAFSEMDTADGNLVAILNETAARRYWPNEDPIGQRFTRGSRERFGYFRRPPAPEAPEWLEIVGVVADVHSSKPGLGQQPEVFHCYKQFPIYDPKLLLRTAAEPLLLAAAVRREIAATNRSAVVTDVRTMDQVAAAATAEPRMRARVAGSFSGLALALGMLGIYGVLSYTVSQRVREIGIRMALGATRFDVACRIVGQALALTGAGLALGLGGAFAAARWISTLLYGVEAIDPVTTLVTCVLLAAAAVTASLEPMRRAMRVDPAAALRSE